jgi:hypothetical protein
MDDRHAQFLIAVGDLCSTAAMAGLQVEILDVRGTTTHGIPGAVRSAGGKDAVDDTGYAKAFRVEDHVVDLEDVVQCTIRSPAVPRAWPVAP